MLTRIVRSIPYAKITEARGKYPSDSSYEDFGCERAYLRIRDRNIDTFPRFGIQRDWLVVLTLYIRRGSCFVSCRTSSIVRCMLRSYFRDHSAISIEIYELLRSTRSYVRGKRERRPFGYGDVFPSHLSKFVAVPPRATRSCVPRGENFFSFLLFH